MVQKVIYDLKTIRLLRNAFENSEKVHAIFIFSNEQLEKHNEANVKIDFLIKNLFLLEKKTNRTQCSINNNQK